MKSIIIIAFWLTFFILPIACASESASEGIASWYGGGEELNEYTASGEIFDPQILTCASWDYPFHTYLRVTNLLTGKSVIVRVNDRGPAKRLGRAIDLTRYAFAEIADIKNGLVPVTVERVE